MTRGSRSSRPLQAMARAIVGALALLAAAAAPAATIVFSDDTFTGGDWDATKIIDTTAGATATFAVAQVTAGGNPGDYRQVTHVYDAGNIWVGHLALGATYDPSASGAIVSLDYGYDLIHINPPPSQAVGYGIAIYQANSWYSSGPLDLVFDQAWTGFGLTGLTAASFTLRAGAGPATPDFSDTGGPMTFGYVSFNSNTGGTPGLTRVSGIDNWRVELTTVPLPAGAWLMATAFSAALPKLRRRSA